jgi:RNA polymerase sigma-70 factor (ECF subfamily)
VERVKAMDQDAWRRLVDLYSPLVYSWCRDMGVESADAADILQEVFRAVAVGVGGFRHDGPADTFRGWLRTIARNKIRDHFRAKKRRMRAKGGTAAYERLLSLANQESDGSTSDPPLRALFRGALESVRAEFEERTWIAFWRTVVDQCPTDEVARQLGLSPAAVRQAKSRVLRRLRRELGDQR